MAQKVSVQIVDDIDGSEPADTVFFALDGVSYEIDLNAEHAADLRNALAPYIGHARRVVKARTGSRRTSQTGPSAVEIREWAQAQGLKVSSRGRISAELREQYDAAH